MYFIGLINMRIIFHISTYINIFIFFILLNRSSFVLIKQHCYVESYITNPSLGLIICPIYFSKLSYGQSKYEELGSTCFKTNTGGFS